MNFPELIKNTREALGETQGELARRFNTQANTVSRWESGQYQAPYKVISFVVEFAAKDSWICPKCEGQGRISKTVGVTGINGIAVGFDADAESSHVLVEAIGEGKLDGRECDQILNACDKVEGVTREIRETALTVKNELNIRDFAKGAVSIFRAKA